MGNRIGEYLNSEEKVEIDEKKELNGEAMKLFMKIVFKI